MSETPPVEPEIGDPQLAAEREALLRDVSQALREGDMERAFTLARGGLEQGFEHPGLLSLRALWFEQNGRFDDALLDLEHALRLAPQDSATLNAKGLVLDKLQRPHEAVAAFEASAAANPRFAPAFHNLGWARELIGDTGGARQAYEQALALKPDYVEPLAHLARLSMRRGDSNSARIHAEQALRMDPAQATAATALAEAELSEGETAQAEARLRDLLARGHATPLDRGVALSLLGDALDGQGKYAEAFAAHAEGNLELKALYAPRFATGRNQSMPQMLVWLLNHMMSTKAEVWRRRAAAPVDPDGPTTHAFMVGFPRSGATFLENVLGGDPSSVILKGQDALGDAVRDFMTDAQDLDHLARLGEADLEPYRRAYWRKVREAGIEPRGKLFIDRLPMNSIRAPVIARLFPNAKMVFTLRDPRDLVLSCFRRRFQMNPTTYAFLTLSDAALVYDLTMRLALTNREKLPMSLGLVRYEDVVEDPEKQLRSICGFLGIDVTGDMAALAAAESARFAAQGSGAQGFYGETVGAWKHYGQELEPVMAQLRPWVMQFGYSVE